MGVLLLEKLTKMVGVREFKVDSLLVGCGIMAKGWIPGKQDLSGDRIKFCMNCIEEP